MSNDNMIPSPPVEVSGVEVPQRRRENRNIVFALLSSNIFGLFSSGLYEYLALRGVVNAALARLVLLGVWMLGTILASVVVWARGAQRKRLAIGLSALFLGFLLFAMDLWITRKTVLPDQMQQREVMATAEKQNDTAKILADLEELKKAANNPTSSVVPVTAQPFLVTIGGSFEAIDENHAMALSLMHIPPNTTRVKGIHVLLHIGVVNNQPSNTMINRIKVEESLDRKRWQKMILIPTVGHQIVWPLVPPTGLNIEGPFFEKEISERVLHSGDLVHGWLALNYPGQHKFSNVEAFRVTVEDVMGKIGVAESVPAHSKLDDVQGSGLDVNGQVDLSFLSPTQEKGFFRRDASGHITVSPQDQAKAHVVGINNN